MMSISHWGMFQPPYPPTMLMCEGYKLADGTVVDWDCPGAIIQLVPLMRGERQPMYVRGS